MCFEVALDPNGLRGGARTRLDWLCSTATELPQTVPKRLILGHLGSPRGKIAILAPRRRLLHIRLGPGSVWGGKKCALQLLWTLMNSVGAPVRGWTGCVALLDSCPPMWQNGRFWVIWGHFGPKTAFVAIPSGTWVCWGGKKCALQLLWTPMDSVGAPVRGWTGCVALLESWPALCQNGRFWVIWGHQGAKQPFWPQDRVCCNTV